MNTEPNRSAHSFPRPERRGNEGAKKKYEHYLALARTEAAMGDMVAAENYFQHAEHYLRSMMPAALVSDSKSPT
jgi:hypothetical protein